MEYIATVKMYKGEDVCHECGRAIRNIVEIDGVSYGVRCCEKYLPRTHRVNHKKNCVEVVIPPMDLARSYFEENDIFIRFWVQPIYMLREYLEKRDPSHFRYAGVAAIIAAKQ